MKAQTYYGARHGLETLSQMISYDDLSDTLQIYASAKVNSNAAFFAVSPIFFGSRSADPVVKIRIRIRVAEKRPDPTGLGSGSYIDMVLMWSKINNFLWLFLSKSKHLMILKIKDKKYFDETVF